MAQHQLDVNARIALGWEDHAQHDTRVAWFARHARTGWAKCVLTQAGFVAVLSQPALGRAASAVAELAVALERDPTHPTHHLVTLDFGFSEVLARCTSGVADHRQVTDAYLLTAATRAGMRLLTFDSGVASLLASDAERSAHNAALR